MDTQLNLWILENGDSLYHLVKGTSVADICSLYFFDRQSPFESFIAENGINVAVLDISQKRAERLSLFKKIKESDSMLDIILVGDPILPETVMDFINQGASDYVAKPVSIESLDKVLKKIVKKQNLRRETFRLEKRLEKKYSFQGMIGKSPYMLEIFSLIEKISKYFSTVLVSGDTGTGKELVARAIFNLSQVLNRNLITFDCTATPDNLFESELFGYVKGAFTGADRDKNGLFEEAHQGIIFLDEIGEIPVSVQSKLLRVLEMHQFRPLGATTMRKVNVKIIAATNRNLRECLKNGSFREDLLHRLNKVEIHLPRLKERKDDIPLLVRHFLYRYNKKFNKKLRGVSRHVQKLFLRYDWPGNIRELENILERASILAKRDFIDITDLPQYIQNVASDEKLPLFMQSEHFSLEEMEKRYITHLLKSTEKNVQKTARILNVSRTTLYSKLKKYNIPH
jgi:DNA-binding NtrC family response regulator